MSPELDRALTRLVNLATITSIAWGLLTLWVAWHDVQTINRALTPEVSAWFWDCRSFMRGHSEECGRMVLPPRPSGDKSP